MNTFSQSNLISLFKSYTWNELYEIVKTTQYNPDISIQFQQALAIKAVLLVAWWSDSISAEEILKRYPLIITDSLTHFAITYAYICLGDLKMMNHYRTKIPKSTPKWMKNYLEIEILGRSLKEKEQTALVRKLTPKIKLLDDYIKVALLQSLENNNANTSYLKDFLEEIHLVDDPNQLSKLLCLRCGLVSVDDIDELTISSDIHPLLIERKALILAKNNKPLESTQHFDMLANTKFLDMTSMNRWLELCISLPQAKEHYIQRVDFAIRLVPESLFVQGTAASYALTFSWLNGNYKVAYDIAAKYHKYRNLPDTNFTKIPKIFFGYILSLCSYWQNNRNLYDNKLPSHKELYVFGESHSLSLSNINYSIGADNFHSNSNYIAGIKMYHCNIDKFTHHAACLLEHFKFIKPNTDIMFTIGEIDTRPDEGIWQVHLKKEKNLDEIINNTVGGYIDFLYENLKDKQLSSITIQGIPAPAYALKDDKDPKDEAGFLKMIKQVNEKLQELTLEKGWNFLDVYAATVGEDGKSNKKWHIDGYHLQPLFYTEADKWLVKA